MFTNINQYLIKFIPFFHNKNELIKIPQEMKYYSLINGSDEIIL